MRFAMTIAGSDSGAGAGMQQDLKTFTALGVYCATVITSITAQNTFEVTAIYDLPAKMVEAQIEAVLADFNITYGKTGMLSNGDIVRSVASKAREHGLKLVVDPVMVSKSGAILLRQEAVEALRKDLLSAAFMTTPNVPEAEILSGINIKGVEDMEEAAMRIGDLGPDHVVVKGGHLQGAQVTDVFYDGKAIKRFSYQRIITKNTHGGGDTLSAAITAYLSRGYDPLRAYSLARRFMQRAIERGLSIGKGYGPANPAYRWLKRPFPPNHHKIRRGFDGEGHAGLAKFCTLWLPLFVWGELAKALQGHQRSPRPYLIVLKVSSSAEFFGDRIFESLF